MKKVIAIACVGLSLAACSTPALTGETSVELDLKGYKIGQAMTECADRSAGVREGRILTCVINEPTFAGTPVKHAGVTALDDKVVLVSFTLSQGANFSQGAVVRALTEKFGEGTRGPRPSIHIWRHNYSMLSATGVQLQVDEIRASVQLMSVEGLRELQKARGQTDKKDI